MPTMRSFFFLLKTVRIHNANRNSNIRSLLKRNISFFMFCPFTRAAPPALCAESKFIISLCYFTIISQTAWGVCWFCSPSWCSPWTTTKKKEFRLWDKIKGEVEIHIKLGVDGGGGEWNNDGSELNRERRLEMMMKKSSNKTKFSDAMTS